MAVPPAPKFCIKCKHAFTLPATPKHRRCDLAEGDETDDAALCGEMRKGACGPAATLWEPINGQA